MQVRELPLDEQHDTDQVWLRVAETSLAWLQAQGISPRDAIVLLPFAQHLAPARRAFGRSGDWLPNLATTHSLAASLGPNVLATDGQISFDAAIDALTAAALLTEQSWAEALRASDARAHRLAVARLVELAHVLLRAGHQRAPIQRADFWEQARGVLIASASVGGIERALALVALEWAAADTREPPTDALFGLRPRAWILVQAGGPDALAQALLAGDAAPALRINADIADAQVRVVGQIELAECPDFEELAQCSAAAVLAHLQAGRSPLALIAQDRVLLRRARALLERQGVLIQDETGWTLATTPPAAQLMALLRATAAQPLLDDWLAWLKSVLTEPLRERAGEAALDLLESRCRSEGWRTPREVRIERLMPSSQRLWQLAQEALTPLLDGPARRSMIEWIDALRACVPQAALLQLPAGREVLDALWLSRKPWPDSVHAAALSQTRASRAEFMAWVDDTLEAQSQAQPSGEGADVVITPLARTMLRPFAALVLPGVDAQSLPLSGRLPALLSDAQATVIGLPDQQSQRTALSHAFMQILRSPHVTLLRRTAAGAEPLSPSPLLERLELLVGRLPRWADPRVERSLAARAPVRAAASAQGLLPAKLSASAIEALRACPYQFFGRVLLGLREADELETQADKRDYGTWLHAVLHRFHLARLETPGDDAELLRAAAEAERAPQADEFLPYTASFERFMPRYLDWLQRAEATGQRFVVGELDASIQPYLDGPLQDLQIHGRIDRVDHAAGGAVLIDYKTGSASRLKAQVKEPLEDTQLAVYAALHEAGAARYLALDDKDGIVEIEHPDVQTSAALLIEGLGDDLQALHDGAPLPALGEGAVCDYCAMRGLCRRDDWA